MPDMAVIAPEGVVGRIIMPTRRAAKVQLLVDRNAAAGAMVERTRAQGVVVGMGTNRLQMEYLPGSADVKVGDRVVTSGIDGIYPKGFVIGTVESVNRGVAESGSVVITPMIDFGRLESVLVVLTPPGTGADAAAAAAGPAAKPRASVPTDAVPAPPPTPDPAAATKAQPEPREDE